MVHHRRIRREPTLAAYPLDFVAGAELMIVKQCTIDTMQARPVDRQCGGCPEHSRYSDAKKVKSYAKGEGFNPCTTLFQKWIEDNKQFTPQATDEKIEKTRGRNPGWDPWFALCDTQATQAVPAIILLNRSGQRKAILPGICLACERESR